MIGGTDTVLWVSEGAPAADIILRTVRHHWPDCVVQNADDDVPLPHREGGWLPEPPGREFFIYKDDAAAANWLEHAAAPENVNTMLYVIVGKRRKPDLGLRSLTLVCGDVAGTMRTIIQDIIAGFQVSTGIGVWLDESGRLEAIPKIT
jgi:hypothetical protein